MDLISVLNVGFIICLSMAILFFIISVVLFFLFDIRTIYMIRSGRAQAKTVKEMQEINSSTGRLRVGGKTQTAGLKKVKKKKDVIQLPGQAPAQSNNAYAPDVQQQGDGYETTERLGEASETTALDAPMFDDAAGTSVLMPEAETSVLSQPAASALAAQPQQEVTIFFEVIKKISLCDTEEVIR